MTYYVGGIAFDGNNAVMHARTPGSRNGISNTPGYKAIGKLARGVLDKITGRYSYQKYKEFAANGNSARAGAYKHRYEQSYVRKIGRAANRGKEFLTGSNAKAEMRTAMYSGNIQKYNAAYEKYKKTIPGMMATSLSSIKQWFYEHSFAYKKAKKKVDKWKRKNYLITKTNRTYDENRELERYLKIDERKLKDQRKKERKNWWKNLTNNNKIGNLAAWKFPGYINLWR